MLVLRRGSEGVRSPYALRKNRENHGHTDGHTDTRTDTRTDGRTDGQTDIPICGDRDVISASRNNCEKTKINDFKGISKDFEQKSQNYRRVSFLLPFRAFCVEGPQNLMFVRPSVRPCVRPSVCPCVCVSRFSILDSRSQPV